MFTPLFKNQYIAKLCFQAKDNIYFSRENIWVILEVGNTHERYRKKIILNSICWREKMSVQLNIYYTFFLSYKDCQPLGLFYHRRFFEEMHSKGYIYIRGDSLQQIINDSTIFTLFR